ncbi:MAG: AraC family transcriptional regulator, partial [Bacteroidota bacterium]
MSIAQQLIFLFSALGAINGFLLSLFFLRKGSQQHSNYFLGGLLLMLSIRIIKSVFFHFNPHLVQWFIQFGLLACMLIGPFLYLYVKSITAPDEGSVRKWWWHILP